MVSRRDLLAGATGAVLGIWFGQAAGTQSRELGLLNLHTGEAVRSRYWQEGRYLNEELVRLSWLLRDHRSESAIPIDAKLLDLLAALGRLTNANSPFHVISGYRSPRTNAALRKRGRGVARRSYHLLGRAVDVRLPGVELAQLRQAAIMLKAGGVGYYPQAGFVHVDTGPVRVW